MYSCPHFSVLINQIIIRRDVLLQVIECGCPWPVAVLSVTSMIKSLSPSHSGPTLCRLQNNLGNQFPNDNFYITPSKFGKTPYLPLSVSSLPSIH